MRFLLVEDDEEQSARIAKALVDAFAGSSVTICDSEETFEHKREEWTNHPPDLVILDLALRAATPSHSLFYDPPNAMNDDYRGGGFRCLKKLIDTPETARVPIILHSVFARDDWPESDPLPKHFSFVAKGDLKALILHIRGIYPNLNPPHGPNPWKRLLSSVTTLRVGPFSIDPRKWFRSKNQ